MNREALVVAERRTPVSESLLEIEKTLAELLETLASSEHELYGYLKDISREPSPEGILNQLSGISSVARYALEIATSIRSGLV